ncbi:MAG: hypothetical protein ACK5NG_10790 [Chthoniobacterales bacterium]
MSGLFAEKQVSGCTLIKNNPALPGIFIFILFSATLPAAEVQKRNWLQPRFDPPPRLAISAKELAELKASPEFPAIRDKQIKAADKLLENPPELPNGPASWIFYYANPETGRRLKALSPTKHQDPITKEIFTDDRTVAAYRALLHSRLEKAAPSRVAARIRSLKKLNFSPC